MPQTDCGGQCTRLIALKTYHNIPRACLLSGSPVPAMDLKSNRSGLWRHILETSRRLRRLCRNVQTMSRDMIKLHLSQHFCRATKIFCRAAWVHVVYMLWLLHILKLQYMHFQFAYFCSVGTYDIIFWCRPVKETYSMKQPDLYYFETMQLTSQA